MIETSSFEHAKSVAQVTSYLSGCPVSISINPCDNSKWIVNSEIEFFAALFLLRFDSTQPPNAPTWWQEMTKNYFLYKDNWDYLWVVTKALTLPFDRNPGETPKFTGKNNAYTLEKLTSFSDQFRPQGYWNEGYPLKRNYLKWGFDKIISHLLCIGINELKITFDFEDDCEGDSYEITTVPESLSILEIEKEIDGLAKMALEHSVAPVSFIGKTVVLINIINQSITYQNYYNVHHQRDCLSVNWPINKDGSTSITVGFSKFNLFELKGYSSLGYCRSGAPNLIKGNISFSHNEDESFSANTHNTGSYDIGGYHYQNNPVGSWEKIIISDFFSSVINKLTKPEPVGMEHLSGSFSLNYYDNTIAFNIVYSYEEEAADTLISLSFDKFVDNSQHVGYVLSFGYEGLDNSDSDECVSDSNESSGTYEYDSYYEEIEQASNLDDDVDDSEFNDNEEVETNEMETKD
ncbi:hypothetical protein [Rhodoferax sp.]|uniref:hypothetical protein n=1 Tax=Rhodoferax sp. TaxID=50421 RepID=UPI0026328EEE|nr:hypothetical protein [Rhodoferax sp.]MDD2810209.1 hypothetical protein [Rhodoferax sp.]